MSISATSPSWNAVESASRPPKRSIAHSSSSHGSCALELDRQLAGLQIVEQLRSRSCCLLLGSRLLGRRPARGRPGRRARRRSCGRRTRGSSRRRRAAVEPADDQAGRRVSSSSSVGTRRKTGRPIAASGPSAAAQEDVVGLAALALLVAHGRALEAEVADPVLAAGVRAAVEVEPQPGERRRRTAPRGARRARRAASSSR